jgi:hypothetical protein
MADDNRTFTNASLQGRYAYANSISDVGSLGLITFDGHGGLTAKVKVNLPCEGEQAPNCPRTLDDLGEADGDYVVAPDRTGVATINFAPPTGPTTYDFIISETKKQGPELLATRVFAVSQNGGRAGQLVAPRVIASNFTTGIKSTTFHIEIILAYERKSLINLAS